jgi:hypothetical protein
MTFDLLFIFLLDLHKQIYEIMSCAGKTGKALKDCQSKSAKFAKATKDAKVDKKTKPTKIESKNTVADLNAANFKNKDVMKWSKPAKRQARQISAPALKGLGSLGQTTKIARLKKRK